MQPRWTQKSGKRLAPCFLFFFFFPTRIYLINQAHSTSLELISPLYFLESIIALNHTPNLHSSLSSFPSPSFFPLTEVLFPQTNRAEGGGDGGDDGDAGEGGEEPAKKKVRMQRDYAKTTKISGRELKTFGR
jgi:hypothetical protein